MASKSDALSVGTSLSQIALCGAGKELVAFGLVFSNTTAATRTVTLSFYRQSTGTTVTVPFEITAKGRVAWDKAIALQPGDHLDVLADLAGVSLLWSVDEDDGTTPIATALVPRGAYAGGTAYTPNDIVSYNGGSYICLVATTGNLPTDTSKWMVATAPGSVSFATAAELRTGTDVTKAMNIGTAYGSLVEVTLTDAATIAVDMGALVNAVVTLGGNRTLGNPTNLKVGQTGHIRVIQDGTGSRTLSFSSFWKRDGGAAVASTAAGAIDFIDYEVITSTYIRYFYSKNPT